MDIDLASIKSMDICDEHSASEDTASTKSSASHEREKPRPIPKFDTKPNQPLLHFNLTEAEDLIEYVVEHAPQ